MTQEEAIISIHVPREGHDSVTVTASGPDTAFLSTCPVRGTTRRCGMTGNEYQFLSTCPVRGTTGIFK